MFWLIDGDVLFKWLADEESGSLAETIFHEDGAELWDCNALELTDTSWLRLAGTLWDAGSDLLEYDGPLTMTDREALTDALSENTLGLSVCETLLDASAFWIQAGKKRWSEQDMWLFKHFGTPKFDRTVLYLTRFIPRRVFSKHLTNTHTHTQKKERCSVKWNFFFIHDWQNFPECKIKTEKEIVTIAERALSENGSRNSITFSAVV